MKIFLCGQRSFGKAVCKAILGAGHEIVGVAPAPPQKHQDKLYGYAMVKELPVISDCERLTASCVPRETELIVSAHSHWLISDRCLAKARHGGIGFHPSLLPRHRGKDAVRWAVHMGDYVSGGTVYQLTDQTDGGDILRQEPVWIRPGWDYHDLWQAIFPVGIRLLLETIADIERGDVRRIEQDENCATWEPSWDRPRLERRELPALCGSAPTPPPTEVLPDICADCVRDCTWCTYNMADSESYHRR